MTTKWLNCKTVVFKFIYFRYPYKVPITVTTLKRWCQNGPDLDQHFPSLRIRFEMQESNKCGCEPGSGFAVHLSFFCYIFGGLECWLLMSPICILRNVCIRTQRAFVASRRSTNLTTHLPLSQFSTFLLVNKTLGGQVRD
jgi:hypothetical protein